MHRRHLPILAIAAIAIAISIGWVWRSETRDQEKARVARTRAMEAGIKLHIADFALHGAEAARAAVITNAVSALTPANFQVGSSNRLLPESLASPQSLSSRLEAARRAVLEDAPIRFGRGPGNSFGIYAASEREAPRITLLADAFASGASKAFREGRTNDALADALALNALAARLDAGPWADLHMDRATLVDRAFLAVRDVLQAGAPSDTWLAELERLWRGTSLFRGLEEVPMYECALLLERNRSITDSVRDAHSTVPALARMASQMPSKPGAALSAFRASQQWSETDLRRVRENAPQEVVWRLRHYAPRITDLRNAVAQPDWPSLRQFPGMHSMMNLRFEPEGMLQECRPARDPSITYAISTLAKAEAQRRVLLAAIAVERTRLRLGQLPATLAEIGELPPDFMDGKPLRYRTHEGGTYRIHSVGFDLVDDDGKAGSDDIAWPGNGR
jgi:hypothetical protein